MWISFSDEPKPGFFGTCLYRLGRRVHYSMNTKMYVGNLDFDTTELQLRDLFGEFGGVKEAAIVSDRYTQKPRGFAFVTMDTPEGMESAVRELHGKRWNGRPLTVNEARPREERAPYSEDRNSRRW